MAIAARLPFAARRNESRLWTLRFVGLDLRTREIRMQVRLGPDTPGAALINLTKVDSGEGFKVTDFRLVDGVPVTTLAGQISTETMINASKVPYEGEIGENTILSYAIKIDGITRVEGPFVVVASTMDSDNAPTSRPPSSGGSSSAAVSLFDAATLTYGDESITVSLDGIGEVAPYAIRAEAASAAAVAASNNIPSTVPRVGAIGDSIIARNNTGAQTELSGGTWQKGEIQWAAAAYPFFEFDSWSDPAGTPGAYFVGMNAGISGDTAANMKTRYAATIDRAPDIQIVASGINDLIAGRSATAIFADLRDTCAGYLDYGIRVILANIRPVSAATAPDGSAMLAALNALNGLIADYAAATPNVALWDVYSAYSTAGRPKSGAMEDGYHPSPFGAQRSGGPSLVAILKRLVKAVNSNAPRTLNLVDNPKMIGTGGKNGTGVTGTLGQGWSADMLVDGGSSAVGSTNSNGEQQFVLTPAGGARGVLLIGRSFGGVQVYAGRWYKGYVDLRITDWSWRDLQILVGSFAGFIFTDAANVIKVDGETFFRIQTPPFKASATQMLTLQIKAWFDGAKGGTGQLAIENVFFGEIPPAPRAHGIGY